MVTVTYLDNSGFVLDTPTAILVFDYYKDPSGSLVEIFRKEADKPVVFFVSHSHFDHFNPEIFNLAQSHKREYVISNEVVFQRSRHNDAPIAAVSVGDHLTDLLGDIDVKVYGSTDLGVSFYVTLPDGFTIFHAGDLNFWHWQEENSVEQVRKAYRAFVREMERLTADIKRLDILMFPVDPRLGPDFAQGARVFMENISVKYFFPMHFRQQSEDACDFKDYVTDETQPFCLDTPGTFATVNS